MKLLVMVLLVLTGVVPPAWAAEPAAGQGVLGRWAVDTSRLPMPEHARPRSVTITFATAGPERLSTTVEVIDPTGTRLLAEGVTPLDGTPTAVPSNFEADTSATTMPRPEVLVMQLARDGRPASTRIYTVSADGRTMVEVLAYFRADGQPALRQNFFTRVR